MKKVRLVTFIGLVVILVLGQPNNWQYLVPY